MRSPAEFIAVWRDNPLNERAGAQPFFLDLREILGVAKPDDPENYCFEHGAARTGVGRGWADVRRLAPNRQLANGFEGDSRDRRHFRY
ncbi:MAG: hypothetical protein RKR03_16765 [Candidatus Competibacter sp.]|nr:hypothetical protein [Candidatus Competibacter sp.]